MVIIRGIHKLSDILDKAISFVIVVMLAAMVIITGAQIVCRIFFQALSWSEEITRYLLIWASMLGAGCVYKHGGHISVTILQDAVPEKVRKVLQGLVHLLCLILFAVVFFYGIKYYGRQGSQLTPSLRWPMKYVYLGITIGMAGLFIHALDALLQLIFGNKAKEEN